jgi:flagellar biogenesis protein FliO
MLQYTRLAALALSIAAFGARISAQSTPGPPEWNDRGASVYWNGAKSSPVAGITGSSGTPSNDASIAASAATPAKSDLAIVPSARVEPLPSNDSSNRHLAPPGSRPSGDNANRNNLTNGAARRLTDFGIPAQSMYTIATGLTIVVGAFLIFVWVLRRGIQGRRQGMLPADAVSVLGRVPLSTRQFAELLRVGNKLVLVALMPGGAETLTEVTDPAEVDRLVGMCKAREPYSTTKAFEQVFQNLSREPIGDGFFGADALPTTISPVAAAYRSQRGDRARA